MRKTDLIGVQTQPLEYATLALNVADDRVADEFAVDAELIGAAGDGFEFEKRSVRVPLAHPEA